MRNHNRENKTDVPQGSGSDGDKNNPIQPSWDGTWVDERMARQGLSKAIEEQVSVHNEVEDLILSATKETANLEDEGQREKARREQQISMAGMEAKTNWLR